MDYALLASLISFTLAGSVTPGPNNIILMSQGLRFGFRACWPYIFGVAAGFASLLGAAIFGLGTLALQFPLLLQVITVLGALWLASLAWGYFKAGFKRGAQDKAGEANTAKVLRARPLGFWEALAFQWVNPKGLIFALGAAAGFIALHPNIWVRLVTIIGVFNVAGLLGNVLWAAAGGTIGALLSTGRYARALNLVMGVIILMTALYILKAGLWPSSPHAPL